MKEKNHHEHIEPIWAQVSSPQGEPKGHPLLFIHGDFSTGTMSWSRQWSALHAERTLIVVDRRGHGQSPKEPFPYTIAQDARDVIAAAKRHSPGPVALVGHSYGAIVALEAACLNPEIVSALYLVEPPYLSLLPDDPVVEKLIRQTKALREKADGLSPHRLTQLFFTNVIGEEATSKLQTKPVWEALVDEATRFTRSQFVGDFSARRLMDLPQHLPMVIFSGGRSHPALKRLAKALHQRVPGSRLIHFPEAGHDVQRIGDPFNAALVNTHS